MSTADEISLRPLGLRPGGGGGGVNPFASFAMGAGIGLKNKVHTRSHLHNRLNHHISKLITELNRCHFSLMQATSARGEEKKKPRGEVTKYPREFMMKFAQVRQSSVQKYFKCQSMTITSRRLTFSPPFSLHRCTPKCPLNCNSTTWRSSSTHQTPSVKPNAPFFNESLQMMLMSAIGGREPLSHLHPPWNHAKLLL